MGAGGKWAMIYLIGCGGVSGRATSLALLGAAGQLVWCSPKTTAEECPGRRSQENLVSLKPRKDRKTCF